MVWLISNTISVTKDNYSVTTQICRMYVTFLFLCFGGLYLCVLWRWVLYFFCFKALYSDCQCSRGWILFLWKTKHPKKGESNLFIYLVKEQGIFLHLISTNFWFVVVGNMLYWFWILWASTGGFEKIVKSKMADVRIWRNYSHVIWHHHLVLRAFKATVLVGLYILSQCYCHGFNVLEVVGMGGWGKQG